MNPLRVCDLCKKAINDFTDLRELQLIKRKDYDAIVESIWDYELCMNCSLGIEKEINRRIKIGDVKRGKGD